MKKIIRPIGEYARMREQCEVMRNLLLDIAENEASLAAIDDDIPCEEKSRRLFDMLVRRKALCAEIATALNHNDHTQLPASYELRPQRK